MAGFILLILVIGAFFLWVVYQLWPVRALARIDSCEWRKIKETGLATKIVDVNDAADYWESHVANAINISVGRLPFVWHLSLSPDDRVLIIANRHYKSVKAARILSRRGFRHLYVLKANPLCKCVNL